MKKSIDSNLHYFNISKDNPEKLLDSFYVFEAEHPEIEKYIENTKKIKNFLITIKTMLDKNEDEKVLDNYFTDLQDCLSKFSNCSEFICFVNACDNTLDSVKKNLFLLKEITKIYFKKRTLNEIVPEEWIQAIIDNNSSRKKGKCGEDKLVTILSGLGIMEVNDWNNYLDNEICVMRFSKKFGIKEVRKNLNVKIKTKKQNKNLDLIIKIKQQIFLLEAKHLNTSGGGQDKQISELIELVSIKEKENKASYISFLDGNYSKAVFNDDNVGEKLKTQRKEIKKYLNKNPNNYFLNTAGFKELFSDLLN